MIKFNIVKEKIIIDPQFLMCPEFVNIWDSDKSKVKKKATQLLRFVFHFCDLSVDNPIKDTPANKRQEEAKFIVYSDRTHSFSNEEWELLEPAIKRYNEYNISADERMFETINKKIDDMREFLDGIVFEQVRNESTSGVITWTDNVTGVAKIIKDLDGMSEARNKIVSRIKSDTTGKKIRGGLKRSAHAQGKLKVNQTRLGGAE
jgi:hypothetical protein